MTLNDKRQEGQKLSVEVLNMSVETYWPDLETELEATRQSQGQPEQATRSIDDKLDEVLILVREMAQSRAPSQDSRDRFADILRRVSRTGRNDAWALMADDLYRYSRRERTTSPGDTVLPSGDTILTPHEMQELAEKLKEEEKDRNASS